ncbi:MAG TPA: SsrA-binding protein SmpB [Firmicutes bacterium]|nr:SsrA-binding protein SmpB [Bacillota bacterium]
MSGKKVAKKGKEDKGAKKSGQPIYVNRKALRDYNVLERFEAGIALAGQEVKSIRAGGLSLVDSYAVVKNNEVIVMELNISSYKFATIDPLPPRRPRQLLLNKREIRKIKSKIEEKGMTLIPLKVFFDRHLVKVELGLCRGKRYYEKRDTIAKREAEREKDRAMRDKNGN